MTLFDLHVAGGLPAWDAAALQGPTDVLSVVATAVGLAMGAWLLLRNRNRLGYLFLASSAVLNPATVLLIGPRLLPLVDPIAAAKEIGLTVDRHVADGSFALHETTIGCNERNGSRHVVTVAYYSDSLGRLRKFTRTLGFAPHGAVPAHYPPVTEYYFDERGDLRFFFDGSTQDERKVWLDRSATIIQISPNNFDASTVIEFRTAVEAARVFESGSKNCGTFPAGAR